MVVLTGNERARAPVSFGEVDGHVDARTEAVARIIESAPGLTSEIRTDMDVWLKYHVALLFPTLAPCLHAAGWTTTGWRAPGICSSLPSAASARRFACSSRWACR